MHPMHPKQPKHHRPQLPSQRTMQQKMINTFTTLFTQTIPVYNDKIPLPQIINGQNPPQCCCPREECDPRWFLGLPNTSPWERPERRGTQSMVKLFNRKTLIRFKAPTHLILANTPQRQRIK